MSQRPFRTGKLDPPADLTLGSRLESEPLGLHILMAWLGCHKEATSQVRLSTPSQPCFA